MSFVKIDIFIAGSISKIELPGYTHSFPEGYLATNTKEIGYLSGYMYSRSRESILYV